MTSRIIDTLMEKTIVPSFSSIGPSVRRRLFDWRTLESYDLSGQVVVLTGGTSGIGESAARLYAGLGATLVIVARNPEKTAQLLKSLEADTGNSALHSVIGDLGEQQQVRQIAAELATRFPTIDVLAHNAGALFNTRKYAENGVDLSVELMVSTPFLLTGLLLPQLGVNQTGNDNANTDTPTETGLPSPRRPSRVLTMSSGGMYTEPLTVNHLQMPDERYQGAQQYARAKRAQVVLNEMWAQRLPASKIVFHALHPGWVATPGITEALPGFSKILGPLQLLRSPREGADTLVWLSADDTPKRCTGKFWHDRAQRSIDMSNKTRLADTDERRKRLWQWCENHTDWQLA